MAAVENEDIWKSWRARFASIVIREQLAEAENHIKSLPDNLNRNRLVAIGDITTGNNTVTNFKVGIIGAGCAGLFTAMIFDHLKEKCKLNVEYEILEASSEDRLGGRLYTYYFKDVETPGTHNYYDVGAMRFPEIGIMKRTFDMFEECGMKKVDTYEGRKRGDLIPYFLQGRNTPVLYNDKQKISENTDCGKTFEITGVPSKYLSMTPSQIIDLQIERFTKALRANPAKGWKLLMDEADHYSVRQYFQSKQEWTEIENGVEVKKVKEALDYNTCEWLETFSYGNRWYDQALSELVLEDLDFNHKAPWRCVEGGAQEIARKMHDKIKIKDAVSFNKLVRKMELAEKADPVTKHKKVIVHVKGEEITREYDSVFNSAPLGSMQRMDLSGMNLNWGVKQAIRSLGYGASCKVGIWFKDMWWIKDFDISQGGVAKTDLPLRVCVYPSYNIEDYKGKDHPVPGVLLCSYTWSQEAQRIATLIKNDSPKGEEALKELLLDNLTRLHAKDRGDYQRVYNIISGAYVTHHAYDWYADPGVTGAFAYFGPQQFRELYPWIIESDGAHNIIGEVGSAHHAWVVGSLESAVRGVYNFLCKFGYVSAAAREAMTMYNHDEIPSPFGPLPYEFNRKEDIVLVGNDEENFSNMGAWIRSLFVLESLRQEQEADHLIAEEVKPEQIPEIVAVAA